MLTLMMSKNERVRAINRTDVNEKDGVMQKQKFFERKWWCSWVLLLQESQTRGGLG